MKPKYNIFFIYSDKKEIAEKIKKQLLNEIETRFGEITCDYLKSGIKFWHNKKPNKEIEGPSISLYLGSKKGKDSKLCNDLIRHFKNSGILITSILENLDDFYEYVPRELQPIKAFEWTGITPEKQITYRILEFLGLSEKDRKVFISYRRSDGLGMADQLFNILTKQGFDVFLDKYDIEIGRDVQQEIYNSIDDKAFLLIIESPHAHKSKWISKEVHYALRTAMPVLILSWFNTKQSIEDTKDLPRVFLKKNDLYYDKYCLIEEKKVEELIHKIESEHSSGLFRRRENFVRSIEAEMKAKYEKCNYIDNWILYLKDSKTGDCDKIINITPRIPQPSELFNLDETTKKILDSKKGIKKILYHLAETIPYYHESLLNWIIKEKVNIQFSLYS
ncbi:MAG: toll/interleukin-1 receptor domain-containing protein [Candidatus Helarchaeota archaeon]